MAIDNLAFIGGGNMARALARGLVDSGFPAARVSVAEPLAAVRDALLSALPGIHIDRDNDRVAASADCIVLAVKPQVVPDVCRALGPSIAKRKPLILSVAAGIRTADLESWLENRLAIIRVMPNQPALIRRGVSGMYANHRASSADIEFANRIMSAVGQVVVVADEDAIDAVTAVSGTGPAYFFLLIDILMQSAIDFGLEPGAARTLAVETARGAAELAAKEECGMEKLIARVRSPGGTTTAAFEKLDAAGVRDIFAEAIQAARERAVRLADEAHTNKS